MAICHGITLFSNDGYETWDLEGVDNILLKEELLYAHNNRPLSKDTASAESEDCILNRDAPGTKQLLEEVSSVLNLRGYTPISSWGHVHPPNASTLVHDHPEGHVSWVYYVSTPSKCGRITFYVSRGWNRPSKIQVEPRPNMMLIFPQWILHEVERNRADDYRISVSGNANLKEL